MQNKLAYKLGEYIGEYLISKCIPCLSCDGYTKKTIQVSIGESDHLKKLSDIWFEKRCSFPNAKDEELNLLTQNEWNEKIKYHYSLKQKYLPHQLKCHILPIDLSNEEINKEIKKGIIDCLMDWDLCEWSLNEEDVVLEEYVVYLKLDLNKPYSYTSDDWIN